MRLLALAAVAVAAAFPAHDNGASSAFGGCGYAPARAVGTQVLGSAVGDMDGDGRTEAVSVQASRGRPVHCRWLLVVRQGKRVRTWTVPIPYAESVAAGAALQPRLIGLAGIARGRGLEAIVDSMCCGAYVTDQWLLRETGSGIQLLRVRGPDVPIRDTFGNGSSVCCGQTPVCGALRGVVLVFGTGRGAKPVEEADVYVQRGDTFVWRGKQVRRRSGAGDFGNCRPSIRARE